MFGSVFHVLNLYNHVNNASLIIKNSVCTQSGVFVEGKSFTYLYQEGDTVMLME
jgi:hypothetical protein